MQALQPPRQPSKVHQTHPNSPATSASSIASVEIHSYLAARDLLLREADANATETNLRRAWAANETAENCLRPAHSPYQAQALPEAEAARERLRCNAVKVRIAQLRAGQHRRAA